VFEHLLPEEYQEILGMSQLTEEAEEFQGIFYKNVEFGKIIELIITVHLPIWYLKSGEKLLLYFFVVSDQCNW
jgi:hypothetical protein